MVRRLVQKVRGRLFRPAIRDIVLIHGGELWAKLLGRVIRAPRDLPRDVEVRHLSGLADFAKVCERYDSVSFDIFDTLIGRVHADPELIKPRTAHFVSLLLDSHGLRHEPGRLVGLRRKIEWHQCGARGSYGLDTETTLPEIMETLFHTYGAERPAELAGIVAEYEEQAEAGWMVADPLARETLEKVRGQGKKVFLLSDMYLEEKSVKALVSHCGLDGLYDELLVSSERRWGKYSGRLFEVIAKASGLDLRRHVHIGDSIRSDVRGPTSVGAAACWLKPWRRDDRVDGSFAAVLQNWRRGREAVRPRLSETRYRVGYDVLGPMMLMFSTHALDVAIRTQAQTVLYLAREGMLFKQIGEKVWEALPRFRHFTKPKMEYAMVSRASVAPGSVDEIDMLALQMTEMRLPPLTVSALCHTYDLPEEPLRASAHSYGITMTEPLDRWDPRLQAMLKSPEICNMVSFRGAEARELTVEYLEQLGATWGEAPILLCDAGWSGTIQTLLAKNLDLAGVNFKLIGCYLGMHWNKVYDFSDRRNKIESGFLVDSRREPDAMSFQGLKPLMEVVATPHHGSASGYRRVGCSIDPVLSEPNEDFEDGRKGFQDGLADFVDDFLPQLAQYEWPPYSTTEECLKRLRRLLNDPTLEEASCIGDLTQSVDWGSKLKVKVVPPEIGKRMLLKPKALRRLLHRSIWKEAALRKLGMRVPTQRRLRRLLRMGNKPK